MPRESGKTAGKLSVDVEEIDMLLLKIDCREIKYKNMNVKHIVGMKELDGFLAKLPVGCSFYASCLRSGFVHSSGEVYARRNEIKAKFGVNSVNASVTPDDEVKFSVSEVFSSRDELLQFVEKNDMELPEDCRKTGFYSDGKAQTQITHELEKNGITFQLHYYRDGLPTKHCRVVANTEYAIACDMPGTTENEDDKN
jgi:hypothetical protein